MTLPQSFGDLAMRLALLGVLVFFAYVTVAAIRLWWPRMRAGQPVFITNIDDLDRGRQARDLAQQAQVAALAEEVRRLRTALEERRGRD